MWFKTCCQFSSLQCCPDKGNRTKCYQQDSLLLQLLHLLLFMVLTDRANAASTTAYGIKYYHKPHDLAWKNLLIFSILVAAVSQASIVAFCHKIPWCNLSWHNDMSPNSGHRLEMTGIAQIPVYTHNHLISFSFNIFFLIMQTGFQKSTLRSSPSSAQEPLWLLCSMQTSL